MQSLSNVHFQDTFSQLVNDCKVTNTRRIALPNSTAKRLDVLAPTFKEDMTDLRSNIIIYTKIYVKLNELLWQLGMINPLKV